MTSYIYVYYVRFDIAFIQYDNHLHPLCSLVMVGLTSGPLRQWEVTGRLNYMYLNIIGSYG